MLQGTIILMPHRGKIGYSLIIVMAVVAIAAVYLFAFNGNSTSRISSSLCAAYPFTVSPIAIGNFTSIAPLGNVNPGGEHILPTNHLYFSFPVSANGSALPEAVPVYSPGNVTIYDVQVSDYLNSSGGIVQTDYSVMFSVCPNVSGYFNHIITLSSILQSELTNETCSQDFPISIGTITSIRNCDYKLNVPIAAGTVIGTAGGTSNQAGGAAMDFGLTDTRVKLQFANQSRYTSVYNDSVCPIDYYTPAMQAELDSYFSDYSYSQHNGSWPVCGEVDQDIKGTLQGNWFHGGVNLNSPNVWANELSIIHDNGNPADYIIDWGGTIAPAGMISFTPSYNGTQNVEPGLVKPSPKVYCYGNYGIYIMAELPNNDTLEVQYGVGSCPSNPVFSNATVYSR